MKLRKRETCMDITQLIKLAIVAAAIGRIYKFSVYSEEPAPRNIYISCLFNVHHIV